MAKKRRLSFFTLADFFIRPLRYHERMSLLAVLLLIPLFTFTYLFIEQKKSTLESMERTIQGSELNHAIFSLIESLERLRTYPYPATSSKRAAYGQKETIENIRSLSDAISLQYERYDYEVLHSYWELSQKKIISLLQNAPSTALPYFEQLHQIVEKLHYLMRRNSHQFRMTNLRSMNAHAVQKLLFEIIPELIEDIAMTRAAGSMILQKKSFTQEEHQLLQKSYFKMEHNYRQLYNLLKNSPSIPLFQHGENLPDRKFTSITQAIFDEHRFTAPRADYFSIGSVKMHQLSSYAKNLYQNYISQLKSELVIQRSYFQRLMWMLTATLFIALYISLAIYRLARRHIYKLLAGTRRIMQGKLGKDIIIHSGDEFADLAAGINQLRFELKQDNDIIDHYVPLSKTDVKGVITEVSEAFCQLCGYTKEELIGNTHALLRHPDNENKIFEQMWQTILSGEAWSSELKNRTKKGDDFWVEIHIIPHLSKQNTVIGFTSIRRDITQRKLAQKLAVTDPLTKLYNRNYLTEMLLHEMDKSTRYEYHFSLIMIDIDNFKQINDTYGHLEGDKILIKFSKLISSSLRKSDIFARWGGEEFIVLLPYTTMEQADKLAHSLCTLVQNYCSSNKHASTISLGVTAFNPAQDDLHSLLLRIDKLLYQAKAGGKNRVVASME